MCCVGQFKFPELEYAAVLFFFILVDALVDTRSNPVYPAGGLTFWIECLGITQVIDQVNEAFSSLIGVIGW
jgi:hypothetical protein